MAKAYSKDIPLKYRYSNVYCWCRMSSNHNCHRLMYKKNKDSFEQSQKFSVCTASRQDSSFVTCEDVKKSPMKLTVRKCRSRNTAYENSIKDKNNNNQLKKAIVPVSKIIIKASNDSTAANSNSCSKKHVSVKTNKIAAAALLHNPATKPFLDSLIKLKVEKVVHAKADKGNTNQRSRNYKDNSFMEAAVKSKESSKGPQRVKMSSKLLHLLNSPRKETTKDAPKMSNYTKYITESQGGKNSRNSKKTQEDIERKTVIEKECDNDYSLICNSLNLV